MNGLSIRNHWLTTELDGAQPSHIKVWDRQWYILRYSTINIDSLQAHVPEAMNLHPIDNKSYVRFPLIDYRIPTILPRGILR